jgi:hypothetical protein
VTDEAKPIWRLENAPDASQDRPIEQECDDLLDRGPFVESLARSLVRDVRDEHGNLTGRKSTGYVVGLTGSWGLGKSSVLNLLALHLGSQEKVIVAKFNPWLFKGRDELLTAFFNSLRQAMGSSQTESTRQLVAALDRYRRAIEFTAHAVAAGVDFAGAGGAATAATSATLKWWQKRGSSPPPIEQLKSISEERESLEKKLGEIDSAVVVLIDELDRVEDDEVRAVAQLVKAVGDIRGISYLVAYDPKRVAEALGRGSELERLKSGNAYLEKIIQHPIPMRPLFTDDVDKLVGAALAAYRVDLPNSDAESDQKILNLLKLEFITPREIKRLIGSFSVIEQAVRGEVNPTHVLAYCWILTKAPELRSIIADELDKYVDDPSIDEIYRRAASRKSGKEDITTDDFLGQSAKQFERVLKLLFPRFGEDPKEMDGTRLSRRRNLIRVLYLGNPPGMVTRQTIEDIWGLAAEEVQEALIEMRTAGSLASFLDRLDDLLPKLSPSGDEAFWPSLSQSLVRTADWIHQPEPERDIVDDASLSLFRLALRDRGNVARVKSVVERLITDGDLMIAPWMVRKHMFQHGLVVEQPARHGETIYDESETRELLDREVPRYRQALLEGVLLRRIPDVEALFVLKNGGFWDSELAASFSDQLKVPEAIYTIAGLFTPPGHIVERKTIAEFVDIERLTMAVEDLPLPENPWLRASFKRFRSTLRGHDPSFDRDEN